MSVRIALGSSRARLVRLWLSECLVLCVVAGGLGPDDRVLINLGPGVDVETMARMRAEVERTWGTDVADRVLLVSAEQIAVIEIGLGVGCNLLRGFEPAGDQQLPGRRGGAPAYRA